MALTCGQDSYVRVNLEVSCGRWGCRGTACRCVVLDIRSMAGRVAQVLCMSGLAVRTARQIYGFHGMYSKWVVVVWADGR